VSRYSDLILGEAALQMYWRLGETSGTNANDEKGSYDGTYTQSGAGGVILGQTGAIVEDSDKSLQVARAQNGHVVGPSALSGQGNARSLECWCKGNLTGITFANSRGIMGDQAGGTGWYIYAYDPWLVFGVFANSAHRTVGYGTLLVPNVWHHIVGTWDGFQVLRLYVDGVKVNETTVGFTITPVVSTVPMRAGNHNSGTASWEGHVDEVAVYTGQLSPEKVANHYAIGVGQNMMASMA
jgi:hypothetical protein